MKQEEIGQYIKKLRKNNKMTQQALADKLMVDRRTISRWENGNYLPDISLMKELCRTFDISIDELINTNAIEKNKRKDLKRKTIIYKSIYLIVLTLILLHGFINAKGINIIIFLAGLIAFLIYDFFKTKKIVRIISASLIIAYVMYSFLTYKGAVRFMILVMGHPVEAYTSNVLEQKINNSYKYFYIDKKIKVESGDAGLIVVRDYWILKIPEYYGY